MRTAMLRASAAAALVLDRVEFGFPACGDRRRTPRRARSSEARSGPRQPLAGRDCRDSVQCPPGSRPPGDPPGADADSSRRVAHDTPGTLLFLGGVIVGVIAATHLPLRAQGDGKPQAEPAAPGTAARASVQDALLKPYHFRFARPTPLAEVAQRLGRELGAPVVLDLAALDRLEIKPDETVQARARGRPAQDRAEAAAGPGRPDLSRRRRGQPACPDRQGRLGRPGRAGDGRGARAPSRYPRPPGRGRRAPRGARGSSTRKGRASASRRSSRRCPRTRSRSPSEAAAARSRRPSPSRGREPPGTTSVHGRGPGSDADSIVEANRGMRQGTSTARPRPMPRDEPGQARPHRAEGRNWLSEPRTAVLVVLGGVVLDRRRAAGCSRPGRRARPWPG